MNTFVALFRGINVGGHNVLPMRALVSVLESMGLADVRTYIQSGNAIFQSGSKSTSQLKDNIRTAVEKARGFQPDLIVLGVTDLRRAVAGNPFSDAEGEPSKLHLYFLDAAPSDPDTDRIANLRSRNERCALVGDVFYLHAPDGVGRSKLAAQVEKLLGVRATARNWRTVQKLMELTE